MWTRGEEKGQWGVATQSMNTIQLGSAVHSERAKSHASNSLELFKLVSQLVHSEPILELTMYFDFDSPGLKACPYQNWKVIRTSKKGNLAFSA
jgi:hypothetical protein